MSPFDRSARLKTDRTISTEEYLSFVIGAVRGWKEEEKAQVEAALLTLRGGLEKLSLPELGAVYLIRTTGEEEGKAAYTRSNAIVLPDRMLQGSEIPLPRLLAHELFHVLSRNDPALRSDLYGAIGFRPCGEIELPPDLRVRKITNPDAPGKDHCIRVEVGGKSISAVPIVFSRTDTYDVRRGGEVFDYMQFRLMEVTADSSLPVAVAVIGPDGPRMLEVSQVSGFFEQVGRNTTYIVHPEEILADNFALLALGERNVPSPEVLGKIEEILKKSKQ